MKDVDVICQIKSDGSIIPIRIKLEDEEHQLQIFNIKRYKPPKETFKNELGYHSNNVSYKSKLDFECVIEVFEVEKIVKLTYLINTHNWILIT